MNDISRIVKIGKRKVVAGLDWMPLQGSKRKAAAAELKRHLVLRKRKFALLELQAGGQYRLVGLTRGGAKSESRYAGLPAVASWFASSTPGALIYIERADSGYWMIAAAAGVLDARTDVTLPLEQARELIAQIQGDMRFGGGSEFEIALHPNVVAGDFELFDEGFQVIPLDALLTGSPPKARIQKMRGVPPSAMLLAGVAIAAGVGYYAYTKLEQALIERQLEADRQTANERRSAEQRAQEAKHELALANAASAALEQATATPAPGEFAQACLDALDHTPPELAGWRRVRAVCRGQQLQAEYQHAADSAGSEAELRERTAELGMTLSMDWMASRASVTVPVAVVTARPALVLEQLTTKRQAGLVLGELNQRSMRMYQSASVLAPEPTTVSLPDVGGKAVAPMYAQSNIRISGPSTWMLMDLLPVEPWMTVSELEFLGDELQWAVTGTVVTALD